VGTCTFPCTGWHPTQSPGILSYPAAAVNRYQYAIQAV
jgi:hypothetical protein